MSEIERRLQELSRRAHDDIRALSPDPSILRRIRRRRGLLATGVALSLLVAVAGGVSASANLWRQDQSNAPVGRNSVDFRCRLMSLKPTYLPHDFSPEPSPVGDSDGSLPAAGEEFARYHGSQVGPYVGLYLGPLAGVAETQPRRLLVLGEPARLAAIHEGFDVTFGYRGCDYVLVAYGLDRVEVRRFAESLKDTAGPTFTQLTPSPSVAPFTGAIWPEDTYAAAAAACTARPDWRSSSGTIALAFASQVLGWTGRAHTERMVVRDSKNEVVMRQEGVAADARVRGIVHVYTTEPVAGCWSVKSVSRPPDRRPTGVSVAIRGRTAEIGFASFGAASAAVEVGYGGRNRRTTWRPSDGGPATFDLDFDPDTRGHFLVLLKDARGRVFSASGGPLPAGDFVAG